MRYDAVLSLFVLLVRPPDVRSGTPHTVSVKARARHHQQKTLEGESASTIESEQGGERKGVRRVRGVRAMDWHEQPFEVRCAV